MLSSADTNDLKQARALIDRILSRNQEPTPPPVIEKTGIDFLTDFEYLGSANLPKTVDGKSTAYEPGLLAERNGTFFSGGESIYSFRLDGMKKIRPFPDVKLIATLPSIYGDKKVDKNGKPIGPVNGLRWDDELGGLLWTYGQNYATEGTDSPSLGFYSDKPYGPWTILLENRPPDSHWTRGGTLRIPKWFADRYTGGHTLVVGFGGYYSIILGGCAGPCLIQIQDNLIISKTPGKIQGHVMLGHPWADNFGVGVEKHAVRPNDYNIEVDSWVGVKQNLVGRWTATDEIGGENWAAGAVWIDEEKKSGVLFFCSQGTGTIYYGDGGVQKENRVNRLYSYSASELATQKKVWEHVPDITTFTRDSPLGLGRVGGVAYNKGKKILYVVSTSYYEQDVESYPVIHAFRFRG